MRLPARAQGVPPDAGTVPMLTAGLLLVFVAWPALLFGGSDPAWVIEDVLLYALVFLVWLLWFPLRAFGRVSADGAAGLGVAGCALALRAAGVLSSWMFDNARYAGRTEAELADLVFPLGWMRSAALVAVSFGVGVTLASCWRDLHARRQARVPKRPSTKPL